jgi:hypothetical protein
MAPQNSRYAVQAGGVVQWPADLGRRYGGIMRIGRAVIIPAVLALGVAASLLTGSAITAAAGHQTSVHVQAAAGLAHPDMPLRG